MNAKVVITLSNGTNKALLGFGIVILKMNLVGFAYAIALNEKELQDKMVMR